MRLTFLCAELKLGAHWTMKTAMIVAILAVVWMFVACVQLKPDQPKQYTCALPPAHLPEVAREIFDHSGSHLRCGRHEALAHGLKPYGQFQKSHQLFVVYRGENDKPIACPVYQSQDTCEDTNVYKNECCYDAAVFAD